jgi:hypothetical protein
MNNTSSDAHMITYRGRLSPETYAIVCSCGHTSRAITETNAEKRRTQHILDCIRANRAADKVAR